MGYPQPSSLKTRSTKDFVEHGAGTKAQWSVGFQYYWRAVGDLLICSKDHTKTQSGRWNAIVLYGLFGYLLSLVAGTGFRLFTRNSAWTPLICVLFATVTGVSHIWCQDAWFFRPETKSPAYSQVAVFMNSPSCPEEVIFRNLDSNFTSLANFTLGLYVSLVLSRIYYAQRGMLGGSFGGILGFSVRLLATLKTPIGPGDSAEQKLLLSPQVKKTQKRMIRWANAIFRLLWLECCDYESQTNDSMSIMEGNLGPLLTKKEWNRIKDVPSRVTHIIFWINTSVDDLRRAGYIDSKAASALADQLNEIRSNNNFGLSSLPYPYIFVLATMTKLMLAFKTFRYSFSLALICYAGEYFGDSFGEKYYMFAFTMFELFAFSWMYQVLLELYIVLRNPNQGKLAGHMPTPDFLQFTEAVTAGMMVQQDTVPRAYFDDVDDGPDVEQLEDQLRKKAEEWQEPP